MKESVRSLTISTKVIRQLGKSTPGVTSSFSVPVVLLSAQKSPTGPNTNSSVPSVRGWKGFFQAPSIDAIAFSALCKDPEKLSVFG